MLQVYKYVVDCCICFYFFQEIVFCLFRSLVCCALLISSEGTLETSDISVLASSLIFRSSNGFVVFSSLTGAVFQGQPKIGECK